MSEYPGFGGMEVVSKEVVMQSGAMAVPGVCVLTQDGDGPFLDTGTKIHPGPNEVHILISVPKVRDMGRAVGMVPQEDVERLQERVRDLEHKYENLDRYREAVEAVEDAHANLAGAGI